MYEWIIIGGGVQGVTMATFLLQSKKTAPFKIRIIDPHSGRYKKPSLNLLKQLNFSFK